VFTEATGEIVEKPAIENSNLILHDVNLGEKEGRDLCIKLKQQSKTKQIPIILISALPELAKTFQVCGADDYVKKPFSAADLTRKVEHFLCAAKNFFE
jgi:response regulator RpfG family c-di-GMP phosphodiesterase